MKVPLLDLKRRYISIKEKIDKAIERVLQTQHFILGEEVKQLEEKFARYCNTKYAIGVASGTDALLLSLKILGIGKGDYVITTPFTFFATAGAIYNAGATPIFVDIEPTTYNIDPDKIKELLDGASFHTQRLSIKIPKIKAIIPVHLYGLMADMNSIVKIAKDFNLEIIEDACQAVGAEHLGQKAGSIGKLGCFSFFPTKNLGAYGDGGMITTNEEKIAKGLRSLRVHGSSLDYHHPHVGYNSRLDTIQAAILLAEFPYLNKWNEKRLENAKFYAKLLKDIEEIELPNFTKDKKHTFHQYTIRVKNGKRNDLARFLEKKNIGWKIYYPLPLHLQDCFSYLGYRKGDLPISEKAAEEVLSLPIFPELRKEEIEYVCKTIKSFFTR
ncbi:MAG: DegT/DnrJ/EryC1/StrS family aminotransferase [candidate division WOR-3 bacterium]